MANEASLYDILGVSADATAEDIKKAFHKANRGQNKSNGDNEAAFKDAQAAFDILRDPVSRSMYDRERLQSGTSGRFDFGMEDLDDMFSDFFANNDNAYGYQSFANGTRRGHDVEEDYKISLKDLYMGKLVRMRYSRKIKCASCQGYPLTNAGANEIRKGVKASARERTCPGCNGQGTRSNIRKTSSGYYTVNQPCTECKGKGVKIWEKDFCSKCKGTKVVDQKKVLQFYVEPGSCDGDRITLKGEADEEPGRTTGDVIFKLVSPKTMGDFCRYWVDEESKADLQAKIDITLKEALCGLSRPILTHLDGRVLNFTWPASRTQSDRILRPHDLIKVEGEGMPILNQPGAKGSLYLYINVIFPPDTWLTEKKAQKLADSLPETLPEPAESNAPTTQLSGYKIRNPRPLF